MGTKIELCQVRKVSFKLLPSSVAVVSVSSCRSWSTHGLDAALGVLSGGVEVVSESRDLNSMKPTTRHRTTARTGVRTDRRAMTGGGTWTAAAAQCRAELLLYNTTVLSCGVGPYTLNQGSWWETSHQLLLCCKIGQRHYD